MNKGKIIRICFFIIFVNDFVFINLTRAENILLSFCTSFSKSHIMQEKVFESWIKELSTLTKGKARVFFLNNFKGPISEQYPLLEQGYADISYSLQDYTPGRFPMTSVFELPFAVPNAEMTSRSMWQAFEKYPDFRKEYDKVKLLALFCHPAAHFHTISKPIMNISDFKDLKLITTNPYASDALRILGASPVFIPLNETYSALEKGLADGILLHWEGLVYFKLDSIVKYSTKAYFSTTTMMVAMSKEKYKLLPGDVQRAIDKTAGLELSAQAGKVYDSKEENYAKIALKKGIKLYTFSQSDMKKLQSLAIPIREQWLKFIKAKGLSGEQLLEDVHLLESISLMYKKI